MMVVSTGRNAGSAAGLDAGVSASPDPDGCLFVNADVRLAPACVAELWRATELPGRGIGAPRLVDESHQPQWSLRREPRVDRTLGAVVTNADEYVGDHTLDWATGGASLVTADCVAQMGQLGESIFRCSLETDYALRARGAVLVVCQSSRAEAVHIGRDVHESSAPHNGMTRSRVVPYRRRHRLVPSIAFWGATLLNEVLRSGSAVHRSAVGELVCGSSTLLRA